MIRDKKQTASLRKNVDINTRILGDASALFLFNFNLTLHRQTLEAFNETPNLLAVPVGDVAGEPVFAIWKSPEDNTGECLPGNFELDEKVSDNSRVAGDIAESISEVDHSAGEMANGSVQVNESAGSLLKLAEQLNTMVSRFKT